VAPLRGTKITRVSADTVLMRCATATARGHPAVTATHAKTLEIAREGEIGPQASCVVAVAAQVDEAAVAIMRGRVELTIQAGNASDAVRGRLNPAFRPGDPLIVRRAPAVTRDALVVDADRAASDLDRALVAELQGPDAVVTLIFRELDRCVGGVLVVDPGDVWRTADDRGEVGPTDDDKLDGVDLSFASPLDAGAVAMIEQALDRGGRVGLRAQLHSDPGAAAAVASAHDARHTVLPAPGLPPLAGALAAAGVSIASLSIVDGRARAVRLKPGTCRLALNVRGDRLAAWLLGADRALIALDPGTPREEYRPWRPGSALEVPGGRARTALVVAAADADAGATDPAIAMLVEALLDGGASPRDAVQALRRRAGLSRRAAYEAVFGSARSPQTTRVSRPDPRTRR